MSDSNKSEDSSSSDEDLDDLLSYQPFSQQSHQQEEEDNDDDNDGADGRDAVVALDVSGGSPNDEEEGRKVAAGGSGSRGDGGDTPDDDGDFVDAIAAKRAAGATLPSEVTSPSQLFWYFKKPKNATPGKRRKRSNPSSDSEGTVIHVPSSTTRYHPCRTCDPGEAKGLAMPQEWDQEKKVLCQFIGIPMGEKNLYSRSTLIPFHNLRGHDGADADVVGPAVSPLGGGEDEGGAAGTGDDGGEKGRGGGDEKEVRWCPRLMARYERQVAGENKKQVGGGKGNPEEAAKTAVLFLDRVLRHAVDEERRLRLERREQREEQLSMEVDGHEDDDDNDDHDHEEELEEPYTQNLNVGAPGASMARLRTIERKKEPIRPGDVITYRDHIYVAGDKRGVKTTTVLAVDPVGDPILTLDNGDFLPPDTHVKRVKILKGGGKGGGTAGEKSCLEDHPFGLYRAIEHFKLEKLGRVDGGGGGDFRSREARRVGQVLQKNMAELREKTKDMALPVDIMNRYRGAEKIAGVGTTGGSNTKAGATAKKNPTKKGKGLDVATTGGSGVRVTKRKVRIRESPDRCSSPDSGGQIQTKQTKVGKLTARDDSLDFDSSGEDEVRARQPNVRTIDKPDRGSFYKSSGQGKKKPKKGRPSAKVRESGLEDSNSEDEIRLKERKRKVRIMESPDRISLQSSSGRKETMRQKKAGLTAGDDKYSDLLNSSSNEDEAPTMPQKNIHVTDSIELLSSPDSSIQTKKTKQKKGGEATGDGKYAELLESGSSEDDEPPTGRRPNGPGTKTIQRRTSRNSDIQKQTNCKKGQKRIGRQCKDDGTRPRADESVTNDKLQRRRKAKDATVSPRGNAPLVSSQTSSSDSSLDDFEAPSRRTKKSEGKQNSSTPSSSTDSPKSKTKRVGAGRTPPTRASPRIPRKKKPKGADQLKQPTLRITRRK